MRALEALHHELAPLYVVKRQFVQRKAMNTYRAEAAEGFDGSALRAELEAALGEPFTELGFAKAVTAWQGDESAHAAELDIALRYAAWVAHTSAGRALHRGGVLFRLPRKIDPMQLVPLDTTHVGDAEAWKLAGGHIRRRDGFALTDRGMDFAHALGRVALLHLVSRAGQGFVRARAIRKEAGKRSAARESVQEERVRRHACRLSARREDLGVPQASRRRLANRGARDHLRR